jgi:hypothetical protein
MLTYANIAHTCRTTKIIIYCMEFVWNPSFNYLSGISMVKANLRSTGTVLLKLVSIWKYSILCCEIQIL